MNILEEERMIAAHRNGISDASEHFAVLTMHAMNAYKDNDEQIAYVAGYIAELQRIAKRSVNR